MPGCVLGVAALALPRPSLANLVLRRQGPRGCVSGSRRVLRECASAPAIVSEQITLPCDGSGNIDNWPAFWLDTTGTWPAGGEIDVVEGLHGKAAWHYHYLSAAGVSSQIGGAVTGFSGCGTHTYEAVWTSSAITFVYDGVQVGQVTSAKIGVPIATGPMYMVNDYAASPTEGGPTAGGVSMKVSVG